MVNNILKKEDGLMAAIVNSLFGDFVKSKMDVKMENWENQNIEKNISNIIGGGDDTEKVIRDVLENNVDITVDKKNTIEGVKKSIKQDADKLDKLINIIAD
jgi:hypothetical protein